MALLAVPGLAAEWCPAKCSTTTIDASTAQKTTCANAFCGECMRSAASASTVTSVNFHRVSNRACVITHKFGHACAVTKYRKKALIAA